MYNYSWDHVKSIHERKLKWNNLQRVLDLVHSYQWLYMCMSLCRMKPKSVTILAHKYFYASVHVYYVEAICSWVVCVCVSIHQLYIVQCNYCIIQLLISAYQWHQYCACMSCVFVCVCTPSVGVVNMSPHNWTGQPSLARTLTRSVPQNILQCSSTPVIKGYNHWVQIAGGILNQLPWSLCTDTARNQSWQNQDPVCVRRGWSSWVCQDTCTHAHTHRHTHSTPIAVWSFGTSSLP